MKDEDEEIGLDFEIFYYILRCISAVKQFGKEKFGALTFDEFKKLM